MKAYTMQEIQPYWPLRVATSEGFKGARMFSGHFVVVWLSDLMILCVHRVPYPHYVH